tara:strand:+ start:5566 stop:6036 length:471 start_codon:yes stop_codon:yes gene_type:complete
MNWYVLCVKKGKEKKVAEALRKDNIEVYCPLSTEVRQWSDRKKKVETALFPAYVFIKLEPKDRNCVFITPFVFKYLFWLGKPAIVQDSEIEAIDKWQKGQYEVNYSLSRGDRVTLQSGPFKGQDAIIEEVGKKRLKMLLYKLGLQVNTSHSMVLAS